MGLGVNFLSWMMDDGGCWIVFSYMDFFPDGLVGGGFSSCLETEVQACTLCQSVSIGVHPIWNWVNKRHTNPDKANGIIAKQ